MRCSIPLSLGLLLLTGAALPGCESSPESAETAEEATPSDPPLPLDLFSAGRAWGDLAALVAIGPRVAGTEGGARAREYLAAQLAALGLEVEEIETVRRIEGLEDATLRHVSAMLPGASPRRLLLVAPYDSSHFDDFEFVGANDGASGAALLLELGRVLSTRSLPYTTQLLFLDGEGRADGDAEGPAAARWHGSRSVAETMRASGELDQIRLLVAFHQVCDPDLSIARDLSSHRMHREEFFRAAHLAGRSDSFPRNQGFESPEASHLAFREHGLRTAVALTDTRYGGLEVPGAFAESAEDRLDHCAPESLEAVGVVTLAALDTIGRRLAKIDRFTHSPLAGVGTAGAEPEAEVEPKEVEPEPAPAPGAAGDASGLETTSANAPGVNGLLPAAE